MLKVTLPKDATLGDAVRAADTLGLELHVRLAPKCAHNWLIVRYEDGQPCEWDEEGCNRCQASRPGDPLNRMRWDAGLPLQVRP